MVAFPNCKINLGLHIVRKRDDGYHDLETIFYPLPVNDVLEVVREETGSLKSEVGNTAMDFHLSGLPVQGATTNNLCVKAYELLKKDFPQLPALQMYLHKVIPMGAGLGGGSADGAFTLQLLNDKFQLQIPREKLLQYALQLGSDCPFFIINQPCYASGRGEILQPVQLNLSACSFLLINPGVHVNTGWAFSQLTPAPAPQLLTTIIQQPVTNWPALLHNDFEVPVMAHHPELKAIKDKLYEKGALYASMTGSGSSFYGIFPKNQVPQTDWPSAYKVFTC